LQRSEFDFCYKKKNKSSRLPSAAKDRAAGNALMRKGEYKKAVTAFTRATTAAPGGLTGRRGGQYAVPPAPAGSNRCGDAKLAGNGLNRSSKVLLKGTP